MPATIPISELGEQTAKEHGIKRPGPAVVLSNHSGLLPSAPAFTVGKGTDKTFINNPFGGSAIYFTQVRLGKGAADFRYPKQRIYGR